MSWVTVIWSLAAGVCLTMGAVNLLVWCWNRSARANLWFAGAAFAVASVAAFEWLMMHSKTPEEFETRHREAHFVMFFALTCIVGFTQSYLKTGRPWLARAFVGLRAVIAVLAFVPGPTFNFRKVLELAPFQLFGETVAVPIGVPHAWARLGEMSLLMLVAFAIDASVRLWRKGTRRERQRALVVGGGVVLAVIAGATNGFLIHSGMRPSPYFITFSFTLIIAAMGYELSHDMIHAAHLSEETRNLRDELAHVTRVSTLNELSGSLAHELTQPLAIILTNAQAAQRLLMKSPPQMEQVEAILDDIVAEDRRAAEIIQRLRVLLKRGEAESAPVALNEAIDDVLRLAHLDLTARGVSVVRNLANELPEIIGDRVQLQQVVLNLVLNGADAMSEKSSDARRLHIATARREDVVRVTVRDEGTGLKVSSEKLFEPFFTTKAHGLGMGLAICRTISDAHGGRLWAESHPEGGASFHLELLTQRPDRT